MSKNSSNPFPSDVASCFWSFDPGQLDLARDKKEIITQVFNYGNWEAVKWVRRNYSDDELREVISSPFRGRWFKQALRFWMMELHISLSDTVYQRAIFDLHPRGPLVVPA